MEKPSAKRSQWVGQDLSCKVNCSHPHQAGSKIHRPPESKALPFVAMRKLLLKKIALMVHLEALPGAAGGAQDMLQDMSQQREVLSLLTWVPIVASREGQVPLCIHAPTAMP